MMYGIVDRNLEATIRLVVGNADSERQTIDALINTGFTGFLTLPLSVITTIKLQLYRREAGTLGDGSTCIFGVAELMYDMAIEIQKHYSKQDGIFSYI